jgi:hypothetical protein
MTVGFSPNRLYLGGSRAGAILWIFRQNRENKAEKRCNAHAPFPPTGSNIPARTRRRSAGGALPRLAGTVLFLASSNPGDSGGGGFYRSCRLERASTLSRAGRRTRGRNGTGSTKPQAKTDIDGAGHWIRQERAGEVNAALIEFLRQNSR